ncbi:hypothetical protein BTVI_16693 [Pitangus sulphuratus]|nr:hypothetical protein BTVI_16693 [Pitangus sulphuratus]
MRLASVLAKEAFVSLNQVGLITSKEPSVLQKDPTVIETKSICQCQLYNQLLTTRIHPLFLHSSSPLTSRIDGNPTWAHMPLAITHIELMEFLKDGRKGELNQGSPKPSVPQVIVMKSRKLKEGGSPEKAACLATNFSTRRISLEMSSAEVVYEQSTPILTAQGFYSAMKVVNVTKDTEVTCKAHFDNVTLTALPEKEAEEPVTRSSNRVCNSTDTPAQGPTVQRVNTLSMAVLGLRVLLAKSIAFNTLMSIKLVLF